MKENNANDVIKGALAGLIGGIVATAVMGGFQAFVNSLAEEKKSTKNKKKEEPANVKAAEAISENVFDHHLTKSEKTSAGEAMHWAMGSTSGLIYGLASELAPISTVGYGLPFGTMVWLIADDIIVPALGFAKPPTEIPPAEHAYALSSHLVYGLTTDLVRRVVREAL